jgi:hypothetical protein
MAASKGWTLTLFYLKNGFYKQCFTNRSLLMKTCLQLFEHDGACPATTVADAGNTNFAAFLREHAQ